MQVRHLSILLHVLLPSTVAFVPSQLNIRSSACRLSAFHKHAVVPFVLRPPAPKTVRMSAGGADAMSSSSRALMAAADHMVAAAAILGENQCDEEDPASLSSGACSIANAGRDAAAVSEAIQRCQWEEATGPLASMAGSLFVSAASLADVCGAALGEAGIEIEDASQVTGCIQLAAAAGPSLISAGESLASAGGALGAHGRDLTKKGGVYAEAGERLFRAGACLAEAGETLEQTGDAIESGTAAGT